MLFNYGSNTNLPPLGDPRLGFAFHDYCLENDEGAGNATCETFDQTVFDNALAHVAKTGDALMETEFGATQDPNILEPDVQRADQDMVSWLEWAFCGCKDPTTSGPGDEQAIISDPSKPATGSNLILPTLRVLVEPYPQLVSGTPLSWGYDGSTKTFSLKYSTARASGRGRFGAGALTEIATPGFVYGGRYGAVVSGGAIASRRGAGVLEVATCRGARTISVTVRPRGASRGSCVLRVRGARRPGSR